MLLEHLDDEEARLLPVAGRYLTRPEWDALGEHFVASTPKRQLLIFLGAVLEDADASERASMLTAIPALARLIWQTYGRISYARHVKRVRSWASGLDTPTAEPRAGRRLTQDPEQGPARADR